MNVSVYLRTLIAGIRKVWCFMLQNIIFVVLVVAAVAATGFVWWFENHDEKTNSKNENEGN